MSLSTHNSLNCIDLEDVIGKWPQTAAEYKKAIKIEVAHNVFEEFYRFVDWQPVVGPGKLDYIAGIWSYGKIAYVPFYKPNEQFDLLSAEQTIDKHEYVSRPHSKQVDSKMTEKAADKGQGEEPENLENKQNKIIELKECRDLVERVNK